jgi:hypothetical protein
VLPWWVSILSLQRRASFAIHFLSLVFILKRQMVGEVQEADNIKLLNGVCVAFYQLFLKQVSLWLYALLNFSRKSELRV